MTEITIWILKTFLLVICWFKALSVLEVQAAYSNCEFDSSLQGTYRIQDDSVKSTARRKSTRFSSLTSSFQQREPVKYKDLFIGQNSIPQWGDCIRKDDSKYVLGSRHSPGYDCYRCYLIVQRTPNVLQVINNDGSVCFPTVAAAQSSCSDPSKISTSEGIFLWTMLHHVTSEGAQNSNSTYQCHVLQISSTLFIFQGSENVQYQFCPVGGRANITYTLNRRTYCPYPARLPSTIDNCRLGYQMDVTLNSCFFPIPDNFEMSLKCLGSWDAGRGDGDTYFAVYNVLTDEFRCGLFRDDRRRYGYATAALSNDSTCSNMLSNSTSGFETFTLFSDMDLNNAVGTKLSKVRSQCSFPKWLQADDWDTSMIIRDGLIDFYHENNPTSMIKIKGKCHWIKIDEFPGKAMVEIRSETHCDDSLRYRCMWFERRSNDIVEVRSTISPDDTNNSYCSQEQIYKSTKWSIMNPKTPNHIFVPCGYLGDFSTHDRLSFKLPKNHLYCTNVSFDCFDTTKFSLIQYSCSTNQIVSEFKYRCLASWSETGDKFLYVLEESKLTKECIVSRNFSSNGTNLVLLIFTGRDCERRALDRNYLQNLEINTLLQPYGASKSVQNLYTADIETMQQDPTIYKALLLENQESCSKYFELNRYEFADDLKQYNVALKFCCSLILISLMCCFNFIKTL